MRLHVGHDRIRVTFVHPCLQRLEATDLAVVERNDFSVENERRASPTNQRAQRVHYLGELSRLVDIVPSAQLHDIARGKRENADAVVLGLKNPSRAGGQRRRCRGKHGAIARRGVRNAHDTRFLLEALAAFFAGARSWVRLFFSTAMRSSTFPSDLSSASACATNFLPFDLALITRIRFAR